MYKRYFISILLVTAYGLYADTPAQDDDLARLRAAYGRKQLPQQEPEKDKDDNEQGGARAFIKDFLVGYATGYCINRLHISVSNDPNQN